MRFLKALRFIATPIETACSAIAGAYLLLMWSQIDADHRGEAGK